MVNHIIVHFDTLNLNCHLVAHSCSLMYDFRNASYQMNFKYNKHLGIMMLQTHFKINYFGKLARKVVTKVSAALMMSLVTYFIVHHSIFTATGVCSPSCQH